MIEYGRSIRWFNNYKDEIKFSESHKFDFMQIWFRNGELELDKVSFPKEEYIMNSKFPVIIHALYDIDDYDKYNKELVRILKYLNHKEVIIHPICKSHLINSQTINVLADNIYKTNQLLKKNNIKLYIENNSVISKINYTPSDLKIIFDRNPDVELLLDIAHIDDYDHLEEILKVKFPKCLHISDKRFDVEHEHLPIGQGELDFRLIFQKYLKGYDGKIIFEVVDTDEEIYESKNIIENIIQNS
ncbi:sugar phosphate isomerase/epimerase [uncultured Clostridium sp.]|uniref:sugar phosphate isomerase/epimerase family protein n=1 Tax=uncultured Clostridium sp. TaxID=59620 RepID=UPI0032169FEC